MRLPKVNLVVRDSKFLQHAERAVAHLCDRHVHSPFVHASGRGDDNPVAGGVQLPDEGDRLGDRLAVLEATAGRVGHEGGFEVEAEAHLAPHDHLPVRDPPNEGLQLPGRRHDRELRLLDLQPDEAVPLREHGRDQDGGVQPGLRRLLGGAEDVLRGGLERLGALEDVGAGVRVGRDHALLADVRDRVPLIQLQVRELRRHRSHAHQVRTLGVEVHRGAGTLGKLARPPQQVVAVVDGGAVQRHERHAQLLRGHLPGHRQDGLDPPASLERQDHDPHRQGRVLPC
mmetsp:Transcript_12067/g.33850  ORF Transcript_12067/g.33850 Transcript_12067/m.33850 type:complete len:285 (-) Transcript_12067:485-1339(-)